MKYLFLSVFSLLCFHSLKAQPCSGMPVGGIVTASDFVPCGTMTDTLKLIDYTTGSGISIQWFSAPGAGLWAPIAGATNATYIFTPSAPVLYYQAEVVCSLSGDTAYSNYLPVDHDSACPCIPLYEYAFSSGPGLYSFNLSGAYGSSIAAMGLPSYGNYMLLPDTIELEQDHTYSGTIAANDIGYFWENEIWIDFNDNGFFEPSENVSGVVYDPTAAVFDLPCTIPISLTADTGYHRMRLRNAFTYFGPSVEMDPCYYNDYTTGAYIDYNYGSTWDFVAHVNYFPPCHDQPNPGVISANSCFACGGTGLHLNDAGSSNDSLGLTYQWQSSPTGISWSDIPGGSTQAFVYYASTTLNYRLRVGCTLSGDTAYSNSVLVYAETSCACVPLYLDWLDAPYIMMGFATSGSLGTSIYDSIGRAYGAGPYRNMVCNIPKLELLAGEVYEDTVFTFEYYGSGFCQTAQVWIDFNDDGVFSPSEAVSDIYPCMGCDRLFPTIHIPIAAPGGIHRMRVRYAQSEETIGCPLAMDPCNDHYLYEGYEWGSAFDYLVNIHPGTTSATVFNNSTDFKIYPNPVTGELKIIATDLIHSVDISDLLGRTLLTTRQSNTTSLSIEVSDLPAGLYLVRVNGSEVRKFVKQ